MDNLSEAIVESAALNLLGFNARFMSFGNEDKPAFVINTSTFPEAQVVKLSKALGVFNLKICNGACSINIDNLAKTITLEQSPLNRKPLVETLAQFLAEKGVKFKGCENFISSAAKTR